MDTEARSHEQFDKGRLQNVNRLLILPKILVLIFVTFLNSSARQLISNFSELKRNNFRLKFMIHFFVKK